MKIAQAGRQNRIRRSDGTERERQREKARRGSDFLSSGAPKICQFAVLRASGRLVVLQCGVLQCVAVCHGLCDTNIPSLYVHAHIKSQCGPDLSQTEVLAPAMTKADQ